MEMSVGLLVSQLDNVVFSFLLISHAEVSRRWRRREVRGCPGLPRARCDTFEGYCSSLVRLAPAVSVEEGNVPTDCLVKEPCGPDGKTQDVNQSCVKTPLKGYAALINFKISLQGIISATDGPLGETGSEPLPLISWRVNQQLQLPSDRFVFEHSDSLGRSRCPVFRRRPC